MDIYGDKELIFYLESISKTIKPELVLTLNSVGQHLEEKVKEKFGEYQKGWAKLKLATVIAKHRRRGGLNSHKASNKTKNMTSSINAVIGGDDPLVLYGQLRDSIKHEVKPKDMAVSVYTDVKYAAVHEYGYKNIPARSYMRLTLWDEEDYIGKVINERIKKLL